MPCSTTPQQSRKFEMHIKIGTTDMASVLKTVPG